MKKILVPLDFSACSKKAAKYAADLAKQTNAKLYLLHVIEIQTAYSSGMNERFEDVEQGLFFMELTKRNFKKFMKEPFLEGVDVVEAIAFGNPVEEMIKNTNTHDIDLLVMGTTGAHGAEGMLMGSHTQKVLRNVNLPVITVSNKVKSSEVKKVLFASDFSEEVFEAFPKVRELAEDFGASIDLLTVNTPGHFETTEESISKLELFKKKVDKQDMDTHIYNEMTAIDGIVKFAKRHEYDLIALATHGRGPLAQIFRTSIAEEVIGFTHHLPVMSIKI